jgi:regulator of nonsense transcripts 1
VVQCKSKNCNKWFCNGKGHPQGASSDKAGTKYQQYGSHIVWHMVKSNHKEVVVHPESPLKESPLECYVCGSKNMFILGYISAKTEACIILLCREPCLSKISQEDSHFDTANWMPLIENKQLQTWLVTEPSPQEVQRSRVITPHQLSKLEELWQKDPKATFKDLDTVVTEKL